jgi:DMSO/TMAO reductase YedYZ molybdopterin-dependent catalytic subunit
MTRLALSRRHLLTSAAIGGAGLVLSGCNVFDGLGGDSTVRRILASANDVTYRVQRLLAHSDALAEEFTEADIRQPQRPNGVTSPDDEGYKSLLANGFADWRLEVSGLVEKPLALSLAQLQAMPSRTQITRHDCVEGWSCIAKWTGVPL